MNPKKTAKYYMIFSTATFGTLSLYFAPVIVTIACPFLFRERMTKRQVLGFSLYNELGSGDPEHETV